jgi:benzoylformate decarboxylase
MRAADAVLRYIEGEGVRYVFGNPGTTEVPFMDAMVDSALEFVLCLQENVAVAAADGLAQATRRPQVANLHTGPGVAQAMSSIYMAAKHRGPVVVTAGNEDSRFALTEPLLRADLLRMAEPLVKWAHEPQSVDDVIPGLRRAFKVAATPPTGPVLVSWPMDVLAREVSDDIDLRPSDVPAAPAPDPDAVSRVAELLAGAERPCFVAGDDVGRTRAEAALVTLAETVGAKVLTAPLAMQQNFPNTHPLAAGGVAPFPNIARAVLNSFDVIVVIGSRAFFLYYYQPTDPLPPEAMLVHAHPDPWEIAKNYPTEVGLVSTADNFIEALTAAVADWTDDAKRRASERAAQLMGEGENARERTAAWAAEERRKTPLTSPGIMAAVLDAFDSDTSLSFVDESVTNSLGMRAVPAHTDSDSAFGHKGGALGWGAGAAIGVALAFPERRIVCTLGDGSLMYCPQALYTAARQKLPILYLVMNNGGYAIIKSGTRAQKQRAYETDTYVGMDITNPDVDFVSLAHGLGLGSATAADPGELDSALEKAVAHDGPFLIDCKMDRTIPDLPF